MTVTLAWYRGHKGLKGVGQGGRASRLPTALDRPGRSNALGVSHAMDIAVSTDISEGERYW